MGSSNALSEWIIRIPASTVATFVFGGTCLCAAYRLYVTSRPVHRGRLPGSVSPMENLGNTCYANSLLQALASSPSLINWLSKLDFDVEYKTESFTLIKAFKHTINLLNDPNTESCSAADVIMALLGHRWTIPANVEQDLFELFDVVVTTWDEELATVKQDKGLFLLSDVKARVKNGYFIPYDKKFEQQTASTIKSNTDMWIQQNVEEPVVQITSASITKSEEEGYKNLERLPKSISYSKDEEIWTLLNSINLFTTPFNELAFQHVKDIVAEERRLRLPCSGLLLTQMQCMNPFCLYTKLRQDRFCVLSLPIPKAYPDAWLSLDLLMGKYFLPETIGDASCDKCVQERSASGTGIIKKLGFCRLPPLLVFRIERVVYTSSGYVIKRTDHFSFPEILDVEKFCFFSNFKVPKIHGIFTLTDNEDYEQLISGSVSSLRFKYRLRAVSVHIGEAHSGHFITYRRGVGASGDKAWYKTSDLQVTRVPFSEVASCEAYMLYYDRVLPSKSL
uniref:ubiquitinyl hydrolase 1 n=1 Tax=Syphacia muris TaxID=451379 RepID=A0A0N5APM8_9BILA